MISSICSSANPRSMRSMQNTLVSIGTGTISVSLRRSHRTRPGSFERYLTGHSMTQDQQQLLKERAHRVRRHIIRLATDGGCFIGASLSCVDILTYLYGGWLN